MRSAFMNINDVEKELINIFYKYDDWVIRGRVVDVLCRKRCSNELRKIYSFLIK